MARLNRKAIVMNRLTSTTTVIKRKYYSVKELYDIFMSERGSVYCKEDFRFTNFIALIPKIASESPSVISEVTVSYKVKRYIILVGAEIGSFCPSTQISLRNGGFPTTVCSDKKEDASSSESMKVSDEVLNMTKLDLPMVLSLFVGKERAKKIKEKKEEGLSGIERLRVKFGSVLQSHLTEQTIKLQKAHIEFEGWRDIINDKDSEDQLSRFDIFQFQKRALYLGTFYHLSLTHYNTLGSLDKIAQLTFKTVNKPYQSSELNSLIKDYKTILCWFRQYRDNDCFPNHHRDTKQQLPPILSQNPDLVKNINVFCRINIESLTVETLHEHIHNTLLPQLAMTIKEERGVDEYSKKQLMEEYHLPKLSITTVYNWMIKLGMCYTPRRKCYYVDNHDTEENITYRNAFITR